MRIIVTGWAGFIGSNLTRMLLNKDDEIMGVDCHTYAARPYHVREVLDKYPGKSFFPVDVNLCDADRLAGMVRSFRPDQVYHLAAESHVCRSIEGPRAFAETNFMGTFNLLEALRKSDFKGRLIHVSTDEAFGELRLGDSPFYEELRIDPRSPYAASKAASDLMVRAYGHTYELDAVVTRCTNNYGPNQHEEKLIPKAIKCFLDREPMRLHGDGTNRRDWIHVDDHCLALTRAMKFGARGSMYCLGSGLELTNKEVVVRVHAAVERVVGPRPFGVFFSNDRPTDDKRYAVDSAKDEREIGFAPQSGAQYFDGKLEEAVRWYVGKR